MTNTIALNLRNAAGLIAVVLVASTLPCAASGQQNQTTVQKVPWHADVDLYEKELPPESLQFGFLIGDWDMSTRRYDLKSGEVIAEIKLQLHAEYIGDKRMVASEYTGYSLETGEVVVHGMQLATYSSKTGKWHSVWKRSLAGDPPFVLTSEWTGNEMHSSSEVVDPKVGTVKFAIRFFDITENSFEWEEKVSFDGGKTWALERTQSAKRRPSTGIAARAGQHLFPGRGQNNG